MSPSANITPGRPRERVQARFPDGRIFEAPPGTPLAEVVCAAARPDEPLAVAAVLGGHKLRELMMPLTTDSDVLPVNVREIDGARIYRRSLTLLLITAAAEVFPEAQVVVEHASTTAGYYCEVVGQPPFSPAELERIETRMREIVAADAPFEKRLAPLAEAVALFQARGETDKAQLMAHRQKDTLALYTLRGRADYLQGYMVPSAGYLRLFALRPFPPGFMLQFPHQDTPDELPPTMPYPQMYAVFEEAGNWLERLGIRSVGTLNDAIARGRLPEISLVSEALHEARIAHIAADIAAAAGRIKVVLVAGPSASGKTTFAKRLAVQLLANGLRPYPLGLDDYFRNRSETPRDPSGQLDYESLGALDVALFNQQLNALMAGQEVQLPHYDFISGQRGAGRSVRLGPGDILIVEGIHGLNPALVPDLPPERLYRVYISALTALNLDRHNRVSTTDSRLIRRVVRDVYSRGYSAASTLRRWESVRRGEKQNIFPFQEHADAVFNSALVHELAVLRPLAEPLLLQVRPDVPEYIESNRLLSFLQWFLPSSSDPVPDNSILREFINPTTSIFEKWDWSGLSAARP